MKRLKVTMVPAVFDQIQEQVRYIAQDSIDNALAWEARLLTAIEGLSGFHAHVIDHDAGQRIGGTIRKMVFEKTYLIHYEVNETTGIVEIMNFRHGARLPRIGEA